MKSGKVIRQIVFPLLAACIWGTAFVFQSVSADFVQPFTFNASRSAVAVIFLALVLIGRRMLFDKGKKKQKTKQEKKALLVGGLSCGTVLAVAVNLQQLGLGDTSPGKAAFITALYVVLVPVAGLILFRKKQSPAIWISVIISVIGLYFLCINGAESIAVSDIYVLLCALAFTAQIMFIDHFSARVDGIELSLVQFVVVTAWSTLGMLLTEQPSLEAIVHCAPSILFVGVLSSGVAYTLQIVAQKGSNPTIVSLLLCLESVFATVATVLMLGQWMTGREMLGSVLMLLAVALAQLPDSLWSRIFRHDKSKSR